MKNSELKQQYSYYQNSVFGHKLTCTCGAKLTPTVSEPNFFLQCPDCDCIQPYLPTIPTIEEMKALESSHAKIMDDMMQTVLLASQEREEDVTQTRTISYTVTFEVTENLEFDPADWDEDTRTMDEYQDYQMDSKREYAEDIFNIIDGCDYKISNVKTIK